MPMASTRLRYWLFCVALLVGLCCVAPAAMAAPAANLRVAKVTALSGEVQVKKAGGEKSFKAFKNMGLTEGDTIITGKESSVTLALDEFKDVRIGENSQVLIRELRIALKEDAEQSTFSLLAGGLWGSIRKQLNLDSRFEIKTANAVMGVRGTELYVRHTEQGTIVDLVEGTITVASIRTVQGSDGTQEEQVVETTMQAGQRISLDAPAEQIADFIREELTPEGLDLFALQVLAEMAETRPDLVDPETAAGVRQLIEQRLAEQPATELPVPPPAVIIYDSSVVPADTQEDDDEPPLPIAQLDTIDDLTLEIGESAIVTPHVEPFQAIISVTVDDPSGLEAEVAGSSIPEIHLTGIATGAYRVTVRASLSGYASATTDFTVAVTAANAAPVVSEAEVDGDCYVGEEVWVVYEYSDEEDNVEQGTTYQWFVAERLSDVPEEDWAWAAIAGANAREYLPTEDYQGRWLRCEVTPSDHYGSGDPVMSLARGPIGEERLPRNTAPQVSEVWLTGVPRVGETLTLAYTFTDEDGDLEGESQIQWYRGDGADDPEKLAIADASGSSYIVVDADEGLSVWAEVTPQDAQGKAGQTAVSNSLGPAIAANQIWLPVGDASVLLPALGNGYSCLSAEADGNQVYVAYLGADQAAHVWKWDGQAWSELANASPTSSGRVQLRIHNGEPYISYVNHSAINAGIWVKRYRNGQWQLVGGDRVANHTSVDIMNSFDLALDLSGGLGQEVAYVAICLPTEGPSTGYPRRPFVFRSLGDGWEQLGPGGLIFSPDKATGIDVAVKDGIPYVAYRRSTDYDPVYLFTYSDGVWDSLTTYNSGTNDQSEVFELQWSGDELYLMTSFFDHIGPRLLHYDGTTEEFQSIGSDDFAEETVSRPKLAVLGGQLFVTYQTGQLAGVQRLNDGVWTHFGGVGISGGLTPSLTVAGNTVYLAYVDGEDAVRVVSAPVPTADATRLPTMSAPTWSESSPARAEWTTLDGASAYRLQVCKDGSPIRVITLGKTATSYDLGELLRANGDGIYTVQIRAIGDGQVYADGAYSSLSQALVGPIALAGVETPVWSDGSTLDWEPVNNAAGYRLALNSGETLDQSETIYEVDVDSQIDSYDFSQVIDIADKRTWNGSLQAVNYYAMVTSLGSGIYANGPTSQVSVGLERITVPPVSEITLSDERDAGDASDFDLGLTLPSDQTNVAEYRVILHASNYYQLKLGDLTDMPSSRYQSINTSTDSPVQLSADLLDWEGRPVAVGESYRAYVVTVPNDGASRYAYSKSAETTPLTVADFRITRASAEADSTHVYAELHLSAVLMGNLSLSGNDFSVKPIIGGVPGEALTGITVYPSYKTISLTIPAVQSVSEYEITVTSPNKVRTTDDQPLVGNCCWTTRIWSSTALDIESVALDNALNQVVLQFAATPNDDRFFLALPGEVSVRLLQSVNLRSDLGVSLALSAYYTSDGRLVINLPHAETGDYGEAMLDFLPKLYPQVALEGDLVLSDKGDAWAYSWRPFQPEV